MSASISLPNAAVAIEKVMPETAIRTGRPAYGWAWILALVITAVNGIKPAVVDDTAYLFFARHLSQHPADPYGFDLFWNHAPQPAMEILMPPVLPYWLAVGIALFGEHLFLLKLWLFPFALILCRSTAWLIARFAPGRERMGSILLALSPAVLVLFNFMLDVPALALGLAGLALFISGCDRRRWLPVVGAGLLAGLAMQTKYSLLILPIVFAWYALLHRRWGAAVIAVTVAGVAFWAWERWLIQKYQQSHFLFHAEGQSDESPTFAESIGLRLNLILPLLGQFGGLMLGIGLWVMAGVRAKAAVSCAVFGVLLLVPVFFLPPSDWPNAEITFQISAIATLVAIGWALGNRFSEKVSLDTVFLIGWVALECAGALGLSPFPAARRVLGICFAMSLLGVRVAGVNAVSLRIATAGSVAFSMLFFAIDCWDAHPEKVLAERAAEVVRPEPGKTVWFNGHWGFQYYCDRAGMKPVVPGQSTLKPGDWLVYPVIPTDGGFYRPWHGFADFDIDPRSVEKVTTLIWDDPLRVQTIPNLYGGGIPIRNRKHPRLTLAIYRITAEWSPQQPSD